MKIEISNIQKIEYKELFQKYGEVCDIINKYRIVKKNFKYGLIYNDSIELIPCIYNIMEWVADDILKVDNPNNDSFDLINTKGEKINNLPYKYIGELYDGLIRVEDVHFNFGFIDKNGNEVIPCIYSYAQDFKAGVAFVRKNYYDSFLINKDNQKIKIFDKKYHVDSYNDGFALITIGKTQNYLDLNNKLLFKKGELDKILKKRYGKFIKYVLYDFYDGMARVELLKNIGANLYSIYGYINEFGCLGIPCIYRQASKFYKGYARVEIIENNTNKVKYINKFNEYIEKKDLPIEVKEYFDNKYNNHNKIEMPNFLENNTKEEYIIYNTLSELEDKTTKAGIKSQNILSSEKVGLLLTIDDTMHYFIPHDIKKVKCDLEFNNILKNKPIFKIEKDLQEIDNNFLNDLKFTTKETKQYIKKL